MKGDEVRKLAEAGDHLVPLSRQSVEVLRALRQLSGHLALLFPSERHMHRPISENTLRALLLRAGYETRHVPPGFRSEERRARKGGVRTLRFRVSQAKSKTETSKIH